MYRQCIDRCSRRDSHTPFHLQRQSPEKLQRIQPGLRGGTKLGLRGGTKLTTSRTFSPVTSHSPGTTHLHSGGPFTCVASKFQFGTHTQLLLSDAHIIEPDMIDDLRCSFDKMFPLQGWRKAHKQEIQRRSYHRSSCEKKGCRQVHFRISLRIELT